MPSNWPEAVGIDRFAAAESIGNSDAREGGRRRFGRSLLVIYCLGENDVNHDFMEILTTSTKEGAATS